MPVLRYSFAITRRKMLVWIYVNSCPFNICPGPPMFFMTEPQDALLELSFSQYLLEKFLSPTQKVGIWAKLGKKDAHSPESNESNMIKRSTWRFLLSESQPPDQSPCWIHYRGSCSIVSSTTLVPINSQAQVFRLLYILWAHYICPINLLLLKLAGVHYCCFQQRIMTYAIFKAA